MLSAEQCKRKIIVQPKIHLAIAAFSYILVGAPAAIGPVHALSFPPKPAPLDFLPSV